MSMEEKQNFQTYQDFSQAIFKPTTEDEISNIVRECYKKGIPIEINGLKSIEVKLVWEPAWNKDLMSEDAKLALDIF